MVSREVDRLAAADGWGEAEVELPPGEWRDLLSEDETQRFAGPVPVAEVLVDLPVALLVRTS